MSKNQEVRDTGQAKPTQMFFLALAQCLTCFHVTCLVFSSMAKKKARIVGVCIDRFHAGMYLEVPPRGQLFHSLMYKSYRGQGKQNAVNQDASKQPNECA